jgi:GNAT superfamily N-acetyltransferase
VIGDGRYVADKEGKPERAELGFIIAEPYRGRGIATLLLRHLARIAHHAGLSAFEADVLAYNAPMLAVFEPGGLPISRSLSGPHKDLSLSAELARCEPLALLPVLVVAQHVSGALRPPSMARAPRV